MTIGTIIWSMYIAYLKTPNVKIFIYFFTILRVFCGKKINIKLLELNKLWGLYFKYNMVILSFYMT